MREKGAGERVASFRPGSRHAPRRRSGGSTPIRPRLGECESAANADAQAEHTRGRPTLPGGPCDALVDGRSPRSGRF